MRILTVTNLFPNPFQPQRATFNREQIQALAREHVLSVIAPISWTDELAARRKGKPRVPASRQMTWDAIPVDYPRSLFVPRFLRAEYGRFFQWSMAATFRRLCATLRPDLVFATWAYPDGWAAIRLARQKGLPVVLKVHGSDILQMDQYPGRRQRTVEALTGANQVVAVSRDLAQRVIELGADPARVHLVYNGVDDSKFRPGDKLEARRLLRLNSDRRMVLFVGNLYPVKGPDLLVEALIRLSREGLDFDLHFVGDGKLRESLEGQVQAAGLANRVSFHGSVPHESLANWYQAADLLVLPSRSEGVPNVLLEAAACATPYVATTVGGVAEVAQFGRSLLVTPNDPAALAGGIREGLIHPPARTKTVQGRSHLDAARDLTAVFGLAIQARSLVGATVGSPVRIRKELPAVSGLPACQIPQGPPTSE